MQTSCHSRVSNGSEHHQNCSCDEVASDFRTYSLSIYQSIFFFIYTYCWGLAGTEGRVRPWLVCNALAGGPPLKLAATNSRDARGLVRTEEPS